MGQVFISYKREDRELTEDLARDLESLGYSVWWDTRLVSGDDIDEVIVDAIDAAEAAIVIWTRHSVGSKWVRSEARRADRQRKLIPVRIPDLVIDDVPPPFDGYHMDLVADRKKIAAALVARGVMPQTMADVPKAEAPDLVIAQAGQGTPALTEQSQKAGFGALCVSLGNLAHKGIVDQAIELVRHRVPGLSEIEKRVLLELVLLHWQLPKRWRNAVLAATSSLFPQHVLDQAATNAKKRTPWLRR